MHRVRAAALRGHRAQLACCVIALLAIVPPGLAQPAPAADGALERIAKAGRIRIGYRTDARPFAYRDESGNPAGYSVALAQRVAEATKAELGLATLSIDWVPVTVEDRFSAVLKGDVDLLCGAESVTLSRRGDVDFSLPIFPGGIGAMFRADAPAALSRILAGEPPQSGPVWRANAGQLLKKQSFAVVAGTTTETWLAGKLAEFELTAAVTPVDGYPTGLQRLLDRKADVLFGDRAILLDAAKRSPSANDLMVHDRLFSCEPLAFALARGDQDFRLVVDRTLSRLYRSAEFRDLYATWWGQPSGDVLAFYRWNALPD